MSLEPMDLHERTSLPFSAIVRDLLKFFSHQLNVMIANTTNGSHVFGEVGQKSSAHGFLVEHLGPSRSIKSTMLLT